MYFVCSVEIKFSLIKSCYVMYFSFAADVLTNVNDKFNKMN
jgi:hypothetical protein